MGCCASTPKSAPGAPAPAPAAKPPVAVTTTNKNYIPGGGGAYYGDDYDPENPNPGENAGDYDGD